jgi:hypothetical protein
VSIRRGQPFRSESESGFDNPHGHYLLVDAYGATETLIEERTLARISYSSAADLAAADRMRGLARDAFITALGLIVLCDDRDFQTVASVTGQPVKLVADL